jgi:hypothetical protein
MTTRSRQSPDRAWRRVSKTDRALAVAGPEEAARLLRKSLRAGVRWNMTIRQRIRQAHDSRPDRDCNCPADPSEPLNLTPDPTAARRMNPHVWCVMLARVNQTVAQALEALDALGPPESGEDKSKWRLRP